MRNGITNPIYQSQFLPLIQRAEVSIKKLVLNYALNNKPKNELQTRIEGIIEAVNKTMPLNVINRNAYIEGLIEFSKKLIREIYDTMQKRFIGFLLLFSFIGIKAPKNNIELFNLYKDKNFLNGLNSGLKELTREQKNQLLNIGLKRQDFKPLTTDEILWAKAKGTPYTPYYEKQVKDRMKKLAEENVVDPESGISLWQKAEIDIRHENQMKRLEELKIDNVRYAWTSTHPDCSKRCEKWQGKLFDLQAEHSELKGFKMKLKLEGNQVYCFNDVINQEQKTKSGKRYKNNIIVGFNCRHHLIPYQKGVVPTEEYSKEDIEKERKVNDTLRRMEREIRKLLQEAEFNVRIDDKERKILKERAKMLTQRYVALAEKYGFSHLEWRTKI